MLLALELELPVRAVGDDRHHRLAGHVAAHDQDVRLVELAGVEELAPAHLGAVDVGREEDAHQLCPISSGSLYQDWRSPTRERSFHRVDFGASWMAARRAATCAPGSNRTVRPLLRSRSSGVASAARYWSSVARLPVTVRHQPQSFDVN